MGGIAVADHQRQGAGLQRLLHDPQQRHRRRERDGDEAAARQAKTFQPMAVEPAVFALLGLEPAPQQGPPLARIVQAAQGQRQGEAHGGGHVAIGPGRYVMEAGTRHAARRQMAVNRGEAQEPRRAAPPLSFEVPLARLDPPDMAAQGGDQLAGLLSVLIGGNGKPVLRPRARRFHTHDCNIQNVPILFSYMKRRVKIGKLS